MSSIKTLSTGYPSDSTGIDQRSIPDNTPEIYEVAGSVKTVYYGNRNDPAKFDIVTTESKTKYHVTCKFFCPVQIGDVAYLLVEKIENNLNVVRQPFVQIPDNRTSICQSFYRSPIGRNINGGTIEVLYERLRELASLTGFGPKYTSLISRSLSRTIGTSSSSSNSTTGSSQSSSALAETKQYKGDGVSTYLSDLAYRFNRGHDDTILIPIVSGTHFTVEDITKLVEWWYKNWTMRRLYLLGLTNYEINACHLPHDEIYEQCIENPFKLAPIPIDKCIAILSSMNRPTDSERKTFEAEKFCGEIIRKVYTHLNSGWIGTPLWILKKEYPQSFTSLAPYLCQNYKIIIEYDTVYLWYPHKVEKCIAEYINKLIIASANRQLVDKKPKETIPQISSNEPIQEVDSKEARIDTKHSSVNDIKSTEKNVDQSSKEIEVHNSNVVEDFEQPYLCSTLTQEQKNAILGAFKHKICIISGGAGTGKTKIIGEIVNNLKIRGIKCITCSFTGKAVARLQFFLKDPSYTMDRLISRYKGMKFDHLIIDEFSMVTTELFYRFIMAFPGEYSITLVGDINQLPPIGWGTMMRELISSRRIPTYMLTLNQRIFQHQLDTTAEPINSNTAPTENKFKRIILENADALVDPNRSLARPLKLVDGDGFYQLEGDTDVIERIIEALHKQNIDTNRFAIICPYKDPLRNLNEIVQRIYFNPPNNMPPPSELSRHYRDNKGHLWCVGDRVMMLGNNYGINIMNGDEGKLISIECKGIIVRFKDGVDHLFLYEPEQKNNKHKSDENKEEDHWAGDELTVNQITQSFAATIHKMQGSEYELIILYVPRRSNSKEIKSNFININLLYTGITRTRRTIWIVGDMDTVELATTKTVPKRMDNLCKRLIDMKDDKVDGLLSEFQPKETQTRKAAEITAEDIPQDENEERYEDLYRN